LTDEFREREKGSAEKGRYLISSEVASLFQGKQRKRKGFDLRCFLLRLGEMSEAWLFASFPGANETASPRSCSQRASSSESLACPPPSRERMSLLSAWP